MLPNWIYTYFTFNVCLSTYKELKIARLVKKRWHAIYSRTLFFFFFIICILHLKLISRCYSSEMQTVSLNSSRVIVPHHNPSLLNRSDCGSRCEKKTLACVSSFKWNANLEILLLDLIDAIAVGIKQKFVKGYRIYYPVCSFTNSIILI